MSDRIKHLPARIAIFPLAGVLHLPRRVLPLNIFEPRYLAMTRDAIADHALIGMVQPRDPDQRDAEPAVYDVGCAGRISEDHETTDGRILITLTGVCRFRIIRELARTTPYRQIVPDFSAYHADLDGRPGAELPRARLLSVLRRFLAAANLDAQWDALDEADDDVLVDGLAAGCPFAPRERQALLEAPDHPARAALLIGLMEMTLASAGSGDDIRIQ